MVPSLIKSFIILCVNVIKYEEHGPGQHPCEGQRNRDQQGELTPESISGNAITSLPRRLGRERAYI
jgi:hypothetical protein